MGKQRITPRSTLAVDAEPQLLRQATLQSGGAMLFFTAGLGCADPDEIASDKADLETNTPEDTARDTTDSGTTDSGTTDSGTTSVIDCAAACEDLSPGAGWARCYSCQCKAAMDGWLPSPEELQCSAGAEMVVYRSEPDGSLVAIDEEVDDCANPSLLYGTCAPGGRLGQLTHEDVTAKWICRQNQYKPDAASDPTLPYDDVGAILHNARTGATCFFDDVDGTGIAGDNWPQMDLDAPDADPAQFVSFFYNTEGRGCIGCHDSDPFNYTPQLQSVGWVTGEYVASDYALVTIDGLLDPVDHAYLVSPEAEACLSCHRLASAATCSSWAPDSLGVAKGYGIESTIEAAGHDPTDPLWPQAIWMPIEGPGNPTSWEATFGEARDTILACCSAPGIDTPATDDRPACLWERF